MRVPGIEVDEACGHRIVERQQAAGLSNEQLADAIGVHKRSISSWRDGGIVNRPNLRALAQELGTTMRYLLTGEGDDAAPAARAEQQLDEVLASLSRVEVSVREGLDSVKARLDQLGLAPVAGAGSEPDVDQAAAAAESGDAEPGGSAPADEPPSR